VHNCRSRADLLISKACTYLSAVFIFVRILYMLRPSCQLKILLLLLLLMLIMMLMLLLMVAMQIAVYL
jgi:hypothetical protein